MLNENRKIITLQDVLSNMAMGNRGRKWAWRHEPIASGKRLHSELENHHFEWEGSL